MILYYTLVLDVLPPIFIPLLREKPVTQMRRPLTIFQVPATLRPLMILY